MFTILIVSRNRRGDLSKCLKSALSQKAVGEILVVDDCSDLSQDYGSIIAEFPSVRLIQSRRCRGLIRERNIGTKLARNEIVFSIDDDAVFSTPFTCIKVLSYFNDPRVFACALPYIDVKYSNRINFFIKDKSCHYITGFFRGTSYVVRRTHFLRVGAFPRRFFRQCEETALCMKFIKEGGIIRVADTDPILHYESPKREASLVPFYNVRNNMVILEMFTPRFLVALYKIRTVIGYCLRYRRNTEFVVAALRGAVDGWRECKRVKPSPFSLPMFFYYRNLVRKCMMPEVGR